MYVTPEDRVKAEEFITRVVKEANGVSMEHWMPIDEEGYRQIALASGSGNKKCKGPFVFSVFPQAGRGILGGLGEIFSEYKELCKNGLVPPAVRWVETDDTGMIVVAMQQELQKEMASALLSSAVRERQQSR